MRSALPKPTLACLSDAEQRELRRGASGSVLRSPRFWLFGLLGCGLVNGAAPLLSDLLAASGAFRVLIFSAFGGLGGFIIMQSATSVSAAHVREVLLSRGRCPNCAYDMRATPDRCPECGTAR